VCAKLIVRLVYPNFQNDRLKEVVETSAKTIEKQSGVAKYNEAKKYFLGKICKIDDFC